MKFHVFSKNVHLQIKIRNEKHEKQRFFTQNQKSGKVERGGKLIQSYDIYISYTLILYNLYLDIFVII